MLTGQVNNSTTIPEAYHLTGIEKYGNWAFRIKNVLLRDGLYDYCVTALNNPIPDLERKGRQAALSAINNSVKGGIALKLLKRYNDPHECWMSLKGRYKSDSLARQTLLMDKFFSIRKLGSMDEYLTDMKEAVDLLEEVELPLPERILVFYTLKNLPKEYDVIKQIILNESKLPTYLELELRLLNEETS
jgi:hypothetical protein